jgi:hypothetical protein
MEILIPRRLSTAFQEQPLSSFDDSYKRLWVAVRIAL